MVFFWYSLGSVFYMEEYNNYHYYGDRVDNLAILGDSLYFIAFMWELRNNLSWQGIDSTSWGPVIFIYQTYDNFQSDKWPGILPTSREVYVFYNLGVK